jgi:putative hydrolase of the HAD superfamily
MSLLAPHTRALLIDAMGTLVRLEPPAPLLREALSERFGVTLAPEAAERAMAAEIAYYRAHMLAAADADGVDRLRAGATTALRSALTPNSRLDRVPLVELTQALLAALRFTPFADALPALQHARRRGLSVVVVSNWDASLPEVLDRAGLAEHLDGVVASAAVGAAKPDPAIFTAALELLGVAAGEAVHVGDNVSEDVAGAQAAGVPAIWLTRDGADPPPGVLCVQRLDELFRD